MDNLQIPPEVRNFLEGILTDAGMTTLDDEMREEMIKELYARLDNYITSAIVSKLPSEYSEEFIRLNEEKKSQQEIQQFLQDKLPNAQETFALAFSEFRDLYLGNVTVARNAPSKAAPVTTAPEPQVPAQAPNAADPVQQAPAVPDPNKTG